MSRINRSIGRRVASLNRQLKSIKIASVDNQDEMYSHCQFLVGDLAGKHAEQREYINAYLPEIAHLSLPEALQWSQAYIEACDMRADQAYEASKEEGL